MAMEVGQNCPD